MKNILILLIIPMVSFGQVQMPKDTVTHMVVFRQIAQLDSSYSTKDIYTVVKRWFTENASTFNRGNGDKDGSWTQALTGMQKNNTVSTDQLYRVDQPLKYESLEDMKINGIGMTKYSGSNLGCLRLMYLQYGIRVAIKPGKYKIEISDITYTHYNPYNNNVQVQLGGWSNKGPCASKGPIENLMQCDSCSDSLKKMSSYVSTDMEILMTSLLIYVKANIGKGGDDW